MDPVHQSFHHQEFVQPNFIVLTYGYSKIDRSLPIIALDDGQNSQVLNAKRPGFLPAGFDGKRELAHPEMPGFEKGLRLKVLDIPIRIGQGDLI